MKKIILIFIAFFLTVGILNAQDCGKYFKKTKKSKSTAFDTSKNVTSKWIKFYDEGGREMFLKFSNMNGKDNISIIQSIKPRSFKQPIILGKDIRIAFIFENKEIVILKFEDNQENLNYRTGHGSRNSLEINPILQNLLKNQLLSTIEVQNPFSTSKFNADKVLSKQSTKPEKLKLVFNCFLSLK